MKDILYISYDGLSDPIGQSQILPYLKALAAMGWKIDIISFEKPVLFAGRKPLISGLCEESNIGWYPLSYTKFPPVFSTIHDLRQLQKKARELQRENRYKIVHCRSYIAALCGLKLKKQYGLKFIFDMRGFYADERVDGKLWNLNNPIFKTVFNFFKRKEKEFLLQADVVISLTHTAKEEIETKILPASDLNIVVAPCAADTQHFNRQNIDQNEIASVKKKLGIEADDVILGYVGSLGTWYMLDEMLDFFTVLKRKHEKVKFLIISRDSSEIVSKQVRKRSLPVDSVICIPAERAEVPLYMSLMNAGIFFILNTYSKKASSPIKQGEFMAMGIPVYCNAGVGDSGVIVNKYKSGIVLPDLNQEEMEKAADRFGELLALNPYQIRAHALEYFDLNKGVQCYDEVYQHLFPPTPDPL